jgi:hypothetical protein
MPSCAHCGGCCARCSATCGSLRGLSAGHAGPLFGGGGFGAFGFFPFFMMGRSRSSQPTDDQSTPVDGDALTDSNNPGHGDAIKTISHVDDNKHEKFITWLKEENHKIEHGDSPPT